MSGRRDELRILGLRMLPWLLVIGLIAALSYLRLLDLRLAPLRGQARTLLEQGVALTAAELAELSRSALVLGQSTAIGSAAAGGDTSAMGIALLTYTRAFPRHAEIAWIDETGRERVRAEHVDGLALLAAPSSLRRPAQMPWLAHFDDLLPAEARFTPLENLAGRHALRVASPIYDAGGRLRGMVVITHDLQATMARLARLDAPGLAPLRLYDSAGRAVSVSEPQALEQTDAELWQQMRDHGRGRREGAQGMWYYQDFMPTEPGPGRLATRPWYFVAQVPQDTVAPLREVSAWQCGGGALLAALAALALTRRRRQAERERERLLADLQANHQALAAAKAQAEDSLERLRHLHDELVRAEKLASLGLLVAGVAHELNTPLGSVGMTASTLTRRLDELRRSLNDSGTGAALPAPVLRLLDNQRTGLEIITHGLERAGQVIRLFKQLATDRGAVERRHFELDGLLRDVQRLLAPRLAEERRQRAGPIVLRIAPATGIALDSYPGPLGQVVENLIANALMHAFEDRAPEPDDQIRVDSRIERQDGAPDMLVLEVADNGRGIDPLLLPRIFDPFFTTRRGRGGTGIGLHLCHHFCTEVLGGRILVDSQPGQGCRFTVRIPLQAP